MRSTRSNRFGSINRFMPQCEQLESREVPATLVQVGPILHIDAVVGGSEATVNPGSAGAIDVSWQDTVSGKTGSGTFSGVTQISFEASATGANEFTNNTTDNDTFYGIPVSASASATATKWAVDTYEGGTGTNTVWATPGESFITTRSTTSAVIHAEPTSYGTVTYLGIFPDIIGKNKFAVGP